MKLQKGLDIRAKIQVLKICKGLTPSEVLKTVSQRLTALATKLRRFTDRQAETKKINALFSKELLKIWSQMQCNREATNSRN